MRAAIEHALALGGGYEVNICESGTEALEQVPLFDPDLILLDVVMPTLSGPDTFEALRTMLGPAMCPVAFLTATSDAASMAELCDLGAIAVLAKPFDPKQLAQDIETVWADVHHAVPPPVNGQLAAALDTLRLKYAVSLPIEIARLKKIGREALRYGSSREAMIALRTAVHSLNGSGASFGFEAVTETASQLEHALNQVISAKHPISSEQKALLRLLLDALERAAHDAAIEGGGVQPDTVFDPAHEVPLTDGLDGVQADHESRLLLVDDSEAVRRRYALAFRAAGFIVDEASNGLEALCCIRERHYDLILLDLQMPTMDGFETHRRLREEPLALHTPIIFLTGLRYVDMSHAHGVFQKGVSGFATKSLLIPDLIHKVRGTLDTALLN